MAELTTLARPYAKAAFQAALNDGALATWSEMLTTAAAVTTDSKVAGLLTDPSLSSEQLADAFIGLLGEQIDEKGRNFMKLLAENKRLLLLPAVSTLFHALKANQEQSVDVEITMAFEISSETLESLVQSLKTRLSREINLSTTVDSALIGGAVVRAGDTVIDSSVRGKLVKLAESMNS
jgi:F-type H+-transporting ATPase subunit delta